MKAQLAGLADGWDNAAQEGDVWQRLDAALTHN